MKTHEFFNSRDRMDALDNSLPWDEVYQSFFPGYVGSIKHPSGQTWGQAAGRDRSILLSSGTILHVDEETRSTDFNDILLEFFSVKERNVLGWIEQDLDCDFLHYVILPLGTSYLLPFPLLRRVWSIRGKEYKKSYPIIEAKNKGYTSVSVAVPAKTLLLDLANAMKTSFEPIKLMKVS